MACRQACVSPFQSPASEYLTRLVANDNRPKQMPEWLANMLGICSCCAVQIIWSTFLIAQLHH